jgi:methylmalonyl-CoA mutase
MIDETSTMEKPGCAEENLFPEFSPATYEDWYREAVASLKGAPFEKKVITKTYEEIDLQPMYWAKDIEDLPHIGSLPGFLAYARGTEPGGYVLKPWDICQEIACTTPEEFNEVARHDLARGQTALKLVLASHSRRGLDPDEEAAPKIKEDGLSLSTVEDLATALHGIDLRSVPLSIYAGETAFPVLSLLAACLKRQGANASDVHGRIGPAPLSELRGCIGADPIAELALHGELRLALDAAYDAMAHIVRWAREKAPKLQTIFVHGSPYHDAGGNAVQELAYAVATGVEYLKEMTLRGIPVDDTARQIRFAFSLGPNFFMEIAKLRAARLVWTQVVEAFGGSEEARKMTIHARTSSYTKTALDPYVNMLRNTTEAFSGAMGGADSMHVCPFDEPIRPADEFSRRVSRNLQIILQEEAHFTYPIDAPGGSWYIEKLTDAVARKAWSLFQEIESKGGMRRALMNGLPQEAVSATAAKRAKSIDTRKDALVGVNMYPNLKELPLAPSSTDLDLLGSELATRVQAHRLQTDLFRLYDELGSLAVLLAQGEESIVDLGVKAALSGATLGDLWAVLGTGRASNLSIQPVRIHRASERFEGLRRRADEIQAKNGNRPRVFMACVGALAAFKPRADFSTALFEVGGFEVIPGGDLPDPETAAKAAISSPAGIIVICSTDQAYPDVIPPLARSIKEVRPDAVILVAGRPDPAMEAAYREAGVDNFFYVGMNVYEMLSALQQRS